MKLHTGDTVVIISGKDKGKTGSVLRTLPGRNHVVVAGLNMRTRHVKKTVQQAGRILKYEASLDASKVMLIDPKTKKPTRIGFAIKDGKKVRIAKKSGEVVRKVSVPRQKAPVKGAPATEEAKKSAAPVPASGKQPFWKRLQFGSEAAGDESAPSETRSAQDHTIPSQNIPPKS